jgi:hypothetical protein
LGVDTVVNTSYIVLMTTTNKKRVMLTTYTYKMTWGETLRIRADLVQASAPIQVANDDDEDGGWTSIPYQTADARHRQSDMLSLVIRYLGHEWYGAYGCGRGECGCLARAIEGAEEVQS